MNTATPRRWIGAVSLLGAALALAVYLALAVHSEYWLGIVTTHPLGDDFKIYYGAYLKADGGENPYEPYGIGSGFIYHPAALTIVSLFAWAGDQQAATVLWIVVSAAAWGVSIWLSVGLAQQAWAVRGLPVAPTPRRIGWIVFLWLAFAPLWETLHIGQSNVLVILALLLALRLAQAERPGASGLALALAIVLKTSPIALLAYLAAARKFHVVGWALIWLTLLSAGAAIQFSPGVLEHYARILPRLSAELHPDTYNQSLLSVLAQTWPGLSEPHVRAAWVAAYRAGSALAVGGLLVAGWLDFRRLPALNLWIVMALMAALVFFSPLVWYHHSTLLLLPLTALLLSPVRALFGLGLAIMFVTQAERLFEQFVTLTAYPIVVVQIIVLASMLAIHFSGVKGRPSAAPA